MLRYTTSVEFWKGGKNSTPIYNNESTAVGKRANLFTAGLERGGSQASKKAL